MTSEDFMLFCIPVVFLGLGTWLAFTVAMFFGLEHASGWDGLTYAAALLGISAPVAVGALVGGTVVLVTKDNKIDV